MKFGIFKRNLFIPFLKILIDALALESAFIFSYIMRFESPFRELVPVTKGFPPFSVYFFTSVFLTIIYIFIFSLNRSYRSRYFTSFTEDIPVVLRVCFMGILVAMSSAFLYRGFSYSRLTFIFMFVNTNIFVLIGRYIFHYVKRKHLIPKGYSVQKLFLVGSPGLLPGFTQQVHRDKNQYFEILGYCSRHDLEDVNLNYLGTIEDLPGLIGEYSPDGLLLVFEADQHQDILKIMEITEGKNVELFFIPHFLYLIGSRTSAIEIAGMPVIRLKAVAFSGWQGFLKRTFDLVISAMVLLILSPFFMVIAVAVKFSSRGPVFYQQKRVGLDGKEFTMLKFRSMVAEAEKQTGPVWAQKKDPRVTVVGRILRRTSLDELPQLINVIKGDMSLVGPRPERKVFVEEFQQYIPKYAERHRVRSGVTGWAQVNGLRGQSPIEERTRYDVYYIENWSLAFDIKIILMTFMAIVRGENAY
ncbi:MAG: undecaprenyl-phosphate glucose phosphotransferase [Calditrichaeota bacterium]|nr:undecaprenyl-phosphate glucose phosphotransferase [Calditrichota bacterium]RQV99194.1 MAG: undecaprenyl-phosphate glucose phosphotransferase [Calditrichota bacterium]